MTAEPSTRRRRLTWGLLIAMTVATFGGPVGIWAALRGGPSPEWPPDRPVEWATFAGICALVIALMILAVAVAVANQRAAARVSATREPGRGPSRDET